MTDWNSPEVIASNGDSFGRVLYALFGLYIWEWVIFLDADWRYVKNIRRSPLSPMMLSFLNRYCLLAALISALISLHLSATSAVNCRSLYLSVNLFGAIALELASIGFTVRIASLWRHSRLAPHLIAFFVACLGTQAWLLCGAFIDPTWLPDSELGCSITRAENSFSNIGHIFNAGYSLVLLAFVSWDYARPSDGVHRPSTASLKELCWFGVAFLASCTNAVFIRVLTSKPGYGDDGCIAVHHGRLHRRRPRAPSREILSSGTYAPNNNNNGTHLDSDAFSPYAAEIQFQDVAASPRTPSDARSPGGFELPEALQRSRLADRVIRRRIRIRIRATRELE